MRLLILLLLLSGCANMHPMYENGQHAVGVAENGGWSVMIRSRQIAVKKDF